MIYPNIEIRDRQTYGISFRQAAEKLHRSVWTAERLVMEYQEKRLILNSTSIKLATLIC
ncbi:MAG: hypothetical protein RMX65_021620 [Nostoc sp. DedQUE01]|nr:hypothetical protein [Nostoc sp. DedQUE11]MDZ8077303.1 hypothetical protein [Nostoc sp. DedQUE01]MDZ8078237.1 hypothetical protein [Nostoc sp. DcaGUA01]